MWEKYSTGDLLRPAIDGHQRPSARGAPGSAGLAVGLLDLGALVLAGALHQQLVGLELARLAVEVANGDDADGVLEVGRLQPLVAHPQGLLGLRVLEGEEERFARRGVGVA